MRLLLNQSALSLSKGCISSFTQFSKVGQGFDRLGPNGSGRFRYE